MRAHGCCSPVRASAAGVLRHIRPATCAAPARKKEEGCRCIRGRDQPALTAGGVCNCDKLLTRVRGVAADPPTQPQMFRVEPARRQCKRRCKHVPAPPTHYNSTHYGALSSHATHD